MNKISENDQREWKNAINELQETSGKLELKKDEINDKIAELNEEVRRYNNALHNARAVRESILTQMDEFIDKQADNWSESEAGQAFSDWNECWAELELTDLETVDEPETIEIDHADEMEEVPLALE